LNPLHGAFAPLHGALAADINRSLTKDLHLTGSVDIPHFRVPESRMFRVLAALVLVCAALAVTGCTGSLRLGSSIHADIADPSIG
jgi:hypothetical protein